MRYVVIGGNAAAMSFAAKMRRNDSDCEIIVIERRDYVSFGSCGLPYYIGGFFVDHKEMFARTTKQFIETGVDVRNNEEVTSVDFMLKEVSVNKLSDNTNYNIKYDKLIICTGARPNKSSFEMYDNKKIKTVFDLNDGHEVKELLQDESIKNITIVGTGFIGLEMVDVAKHLNKNITLIGRSNNILSSVIGNDMVEIVEDNIRDSDVNFLNNCTITNVELQSDDTYKITTNNEVINADLIINATGFIPNSEMFDLDKKNGAIVINDKFETSQKDVYALGDCALSYNMVLDDYLYVPLATTANKMGRNLADTLCGKKTSFKGMLNSSCIKVLDYEIAVTGITAKLAEKHNIEVKETTIKAKNHTSYYPNQQDIYIKLIYKTDTHVIVGAQLVGKDGVVGRCDVLAACIYNENTVEELGYMDFCYAPPFASTWDALNVAGNASK